MRTKVPVLIALALAAGYTAPATASTNAVAVAKCADLISGGDIGERICIDDGDCLVSRYHTTLTGTERTCLVRRSGSATY